MWLVKKVTKASSKVTETVASKVKKISSTVLKQDTQVVKMTKSMISNTDNLLSMKQMSQIAMKSYDIDNFNDMIDFIAVKLADIKMEKKSLKKRLNLLVIVTYLIKHGASGFIDQFRNMEEVFTKYQVLVVNDEEQKDKFKSVLTDLEQRAAYIKVLLNDKTVLAREKEVSRMVKEKMLMQQGDYSQQGKVKTGSGQINEVTEQSENKIAKIQSFLELYVWKYTAKLDKKLDEITDVIIDKIDNYLDGDIPQSFDIDELEEQGTEKQKTEKQQNIVRSEKVFMNGKLQVQENLLDLKVEPQLLKCESNQTQKKEQGEDFPLVKLEIGELKKQEIDKENKESSNMPEKVSN